MIHVIDHHNEDERGYSVDIDWSSFPVNTDFSVNFRVLHKISPQQGHVFVIQCFPVGQGAYYPTQDDKALARELIRDKVSRYLPTWVSPENNLPISSLVIDATKESINACIAQ